MRSARRCLVKGVVSHAARWIHLVFNYSQDLKNSNPISTYWRLHVRDHNLSTIYMTCVNSRIQLLPVATHLHYIPCNLFYHISSLSLSFFPYLFITSWQPMLRYGESAFTKESQAIEFFVVVALDYYENSGQLLNYVYIDICPRRRLHRICAFKKG